MVSQSIDAIEDLTEYGLEKGLRGEHDVMGKCQFKFSASQLYLGCFLVLAALFLSDCVATTHKDTSNPISQEASENERAKCQKLEAENLEVKLTLEKETAAHERLKVKMARVELHLLEKETQLKGFDERLKSMQEKLDIAYQEVVRAKAKLRSLESKAEAASNMAEAEVALKALQAKSGGQDKDPEMIQAERLLKDSAQEFKKQNYGGALYLAQHAKTLIEMCQSRMMGRGKIPSTAGEVLFALPVPLHLLKTSNVRNGPGLGFKVLFTLKKGTPVTGHSYKDQWVWVKGADGRSGWIFHTLMHKR